MRPSPAPLDSLQAVRGGPVVGAFFIWLTRVLDNAHWLSESAKSPEVGLKVLEEELAPLEAEVWRSQGS